MSQDSRPVNQVLAGMNEQQVLELLAKFGQKIAKKFRQDLTGENEEFLERTVRGFRGKITRCAWKHTQKWCKWDNEGPVLMPDYTRIYYRKGGTEVVVQEMPPQIRLAQFKGSLLRDSTVEEITSQEADKIHTFSLAFPYVVFLFKFRDGKFVECRCAFLDRPLKRLEEKPLRPYLPNIDNNLLVCLGRSFDHSQLEEGNVAQQAAYVLSHFWQSIYTDEWSQHYWNVKRHFQQNNESRLATLDAWQEASTDNPLFVIEDVSWLGQGEDSFGDMVVRMFDDDRTNVEFSEDLYRGLADDFLEEVKTTLGQSMSNVGDRITSMSAEQAKAELLACLATEQLA